MRGYTLQNPSKYVLSNTIMSQYPYWRDDNVNGKVYLHTVSFVAEITLKSSRNFPVQLLFLCEWLHLLHVIDEVHHDGPLGARPGHGRGSWGGSNDVGSRGGYLPSLPPARWRCKSRHILYLYPSFTFSTEVLMMPPWSLGTCTGSLVDLNSDAWNKTKSFHDVWSTQKNKPSAAYFIHNDTDYEMD